MRFDFSGSLKNDFYLSGCLKTVKRIATIKNTKKHSQVKNLWHNLMTPPNGAYAFKRDAVY
ncbi:hypothetical protein [Simonsiella muelleri]|uniref:hypothetical protein n=1 Tax=Simonsiella muelleri TaxID=72 RepID=UPI0028D6BAAE|nr:hypothetical protein [Simonsiella muelleri]